MIDHDCFSGGKFDHSNFESSALLETNHWEFSVEKCRRCGRRYLQAYMESNGFPQSGKWIRGEIDHEILPDLLNEQALLGFLHRRPRLFYGGSHWGHNGRWAIKCPPNSPLYQVLAMDIWDPQFKPVD